VMSTPLDAPLQSAAAPASAAALDHSVCEAVVTSNLPKSTQPSQDALDASTMSARNPSFSIPRGPANPQVSGLARPPRRRMSHDELIAHARDLEHKTTEAITRARSSIDRAKMEAEERRHKLTLELGIHTGYLQSSTTDHSMQEPGWGLTQQGLSIDANGSLMGVRRGDACDVSLQDMRCTRRGISAEPYKGAQSYKGLSENQASSSEATWPSEYNYKYSPQHRLDYAGSQSTSVDRQGGWCLPRDAVPAATSVLAATRASYREDALSKEATCDVSQMAQMPTEAYSRCASRSPAVFASRSTTPGVSAGGRGVPVEHSTYRERVNGDNSAYRPIVPPLPWSSEAFENADRTGSTSRSVRPPLVDAGGLLNQYHNFGNDDSGSDKVAQRHNEKGFDDAVCLQSWNKDSLPRSPRGRQQRRRSKSPEGRSMSLRAFIRSTSKSPERQVERSGL
jgi:hypothetical protein